MNCAAPDTGNMEVLERVGTPEQKKQWLEPLLEGKIRSAYCMTELNTASSDAKNIDTRAVRVGDEYVINGEKHYISGAGDPRCKVMIAMVRTGGEHDPPHLQQSQILVPLPTPGVSRGTRICDCCLLGAASGLVFTITMRILQRGSPTPEM